MARGKKLRDGATGLPHPPGSRRAEGVYTTSLVTTSRISSFDTGSLHNESVGRSFATTHIHSNFSRG